MRAFRFVAAGVLTFLLVAIYYWIPLHALAPAHPARRWIALALLLVALGAAIAAQIRAVAIAPLDDVLAGLPLVLTLTVLAFSAIDYVVALGPGQFVGLKSRTDALYFAMATLSTVGYGDIHAQGGQARATVTLQMVFNLVFVAAAIATGGARLQSRLAVSKG